MLTAVEIDSVFFEQGRVLITCTIEAIDEYFGAFNVQGYGSSKREALNDANAALNELLEMPDSLHDPDEPIDDENDLRHMAIG